MWFRHFQLIFTYPLIKIKPHDYKWVQQLPNLQVAMRCALYYPFLSLDSTADMSNCVIQHSRNITYSTNFVHNITQLWYFFVVFQGMLQIGPAKCTFGSGRDRDIDPRICAPVMLGRTIYPFSPFFCGILSNLQWMTTSQTLDGHLGGGKSTAFDKFLGH